MVTIVWFKRDLRIHDHRPLALAAGRGPVLPLYIVEPSILAAADFDPSHWTFIRQSLQALRRDLARLGQPLVVRLGEAVDVLEAFRRQLPLAGMLAHEETGNAISYSRDRDVRRWAKTQGVPFTEIPQFGVVRRLKTRDVWASLWERRMAEPLTPAPAALRPVEGVEPGPIPTHKTAGLLPNHRQLQQQGGERHASATLESFLYERGTNYTRAMSSPLTAWDECSRISPYLTWGNISMRTVVQRTRARAADLRALAPETRGEHDGLWLRSLSSFEARLHWHCHFMQKLEDEPAIEFEPFVRAYNGMREPHFRQEWLDAWAAGQTGYPLVDACMRALRTTGWLNFRMRAMLTSFAAYHLFLDWRVFGDILARRWLDNEPGIHIAQSQMQSGTTGINTLRIYSPTKQAQDQDPQGIFIRQWVPELAGVPNSFIHMPWLMNEGVQQQAGCRIGVNYPAPIVRHEDAVKLARARIGAIRNQEATRLEADMVQLRHGSRMRRPQRPRTRKPTPQERGQLALELPDDV